MQKQNVPMNYTLRKLNLAQNCYKTTVLAFLQTLNVLKIFELFFATDFNVVKLKAARIEMDSLG